MDSRQAAGVVAQLKWLKDRIKEWEDEAKSVLLHALEGGERTKAVAPDGTELGKVSIVEGRKTMRIDSEEGFLMWVKSRYPHEIVETVRPAFVKLCEEKVKKLGGLPDANGELCPHVSLAQGEDYVLPKLNDDADALMQHMIQQRNLGDIIHPPALPPPDANASASQDVSGSEHNDPEPFTEEGPPNWPDSNTFETSDPVSKRR